MALADYPYHNYYYVDYYYYYVFPLNLILLALILDPPIQIVIPQSTAPPLTTADLLQITNAILVAAPENRIPLIKSFKIKGFCLVPKIVLAVVAEYTADASCYF